MRFKEFVSFAKLSVRKNSPEIMTAVGVAGVVSTSYLVAKASFEAAEIIRTNEFEDKKEAFKVLAPIYIPATISGISTIVFIVGANRISSKRAAAAYSIMTISEKAFEEYKEKVIEKLGERKEKAIHDEIAQERVEKNPPASIIVSGSGGVICCELGTGRYFNCDMETLRKAQNDINAKLIGEMTASLSDFYYMIGLPNTSYSWDVGWESGKNMELGFSTVLTPDGKPCLAFEYNYIKPI